MNLKLKTQRFVELTPSQIFERLKTYLSSNDYKIIKTTDSSISFNGDINDWKLVSNSGYYNKVNEGKLEISNKEMGSSIALTYFVSINFELVELILLLLASIFISPYALILILAISVNFAFKILNINNNFIINILN